MILLLCLFYFIYFFFPVHSLLDSLLFYQGCHVCSTFLEGSLWYDYGTTLKSPRDGDAESDTMSGEMGTTSTLESAGAGEERSRNQELYNSV